MYAMNIKTAPISSLLRKDLNNMNKLKQMTSSLSFRVLFGIVLLLYTFNVIISLAGYFQFTASFTRQYNDCAFYTAETAATLVDGDKIQEYLKTGGDSDEYRNALQRMNILCQKQNVTLIYVISVDTSDYNHFRSVFNTVNESTGYTPWDVGYERETTNDEYRKVYKELYENGLERGTVARTSGLKGREPHITSLLPIRNSQGEVTAILCVERPMTELSTGRRGYLRTVAVAMILLSLFACFCAAIYLRKQFVTPIKKIIKEARRFAKENTRMSHEDFGKISRIRELNELASSVERMETDTLQYMENLTTITAEKERIGTELALATKIQANMLPSLFPAFPERTEFDIFASMTPAKEVGGDFYDFFLIDNDHLGLVMADVSGKGVPAALFMMMSKILVNNFAMLGGSPATVLECVNNAVCKNNEDSMFVTVWFGILTISSGMLKAANAGHEYPAIRRADGEFELFKDKHGLAVGCMKNMKYKDYELQLNKGDTLFLYTDGVPEATDAAKEMFTTEGMLAALNQEPDAKPQKILENVKTAVDAFAGDAPQFDDLTMLAIKMLK